MEDRILTTEEVAAALREVRTEDRILTTQQVAKLMQFNYETARRYLVSGKLPGRKIGKSWRVLESDLKRFLSDGNQPPPEATHEP